MMPIIPEDGLESGSEELSGAFFLRGVWFSRSRRIAGVVSSFLLGQGAAQGINILAGVYLVRHLSVAAYAQFGLATGFQAVFATLMDMGLAGTIIPLVGDCKDDAALVGRYVRAAKHLRDRIFLILAPIVGVSFFAVMHRQHWSWSLQVMLLGSTLIALYSGGKASYFSAPLFLHRKLRSYYVPQVLSGLLRLAIYVGLFVSGALNAAIASLLASLNVTLNATWFEKKGRALLSWPDCDDSATERSMIDTIVPAAPAIIFAAFQSQITLLLISVFGGSTIYIAQVAALGRIGQLFSVLMMFNLIVIEPYMARLMRSALLTTYFKLTGVASLTSVLVTYAAFTWPQAVLLLVGSKYRDLSGLIGWVILSACLNYIAGLLWIMNRARRWIFWSGSIVEVALLCGAQLAYIVFVGVNTTRQAVFLNLAASTCQLIAHGYVSMLGLSKVDPDDGVRQEMHSAPVANLS